MIWSRCQKSYSDGSLVGAGGGGCFVLSLGVVRVEVSRC